MDNFRSPEIEGSVISERTLIEMFATEKQKNKYSEKGYFTGTQKQNILYKAGAMCKIEDLGSRQYRIDKVYKYPVPKNFSKMNSGMHKYLIPLILIKLIGRKIYDEIYDKENMTFTLMKWYRMVDMINDNYIAMKNNITYSSERFGIDENIMYDFFNTTDDSLIYYFKKSLQYLKEADLFNYQEINWICIRGAESKEEGGIAKLNIKNIHRRATQEEMETIRKCEQKASKDAGITIESEKFFSEKSKKYLSIYNEELKKSNILFCYKAYEIYSTDKDIERCYNLLKNFEVETQQEQELMIKVNEMFQNNIMINANDRINKRNENSNYILGKPEIKRLLGKYSSLVGMTISQEFEKIEMPSTVSELDKVFIGDFINKKINVSLNDNNIKIGVN
jgi:hypothetical protein